MPGVRIACEFSSSGPILSYPIQNKDAAMLSNERVKRSKSSQHPDASEPVAGKPAGRTRRFGVVEKDRVLCFCCTLSFTNSQERDAHLQKVHPKWSEDMVRKIVPGRSRSNE